MERYTTDCIKIFYTVAYIDGKAPRDAPVPVVLSSSLAECIIAGVASSIGILSSIFFFAFNIYYKNHM